MHLLLIKQKVLLVGGVVRMYLVLIFSLPGTCYS